MSSAYPECSFTAHSGLIRSNSALSSAKFNFKQMSTLLTFYPSIYSCNQIFLCITSSLPLFLQLELGAEIFRIMPWPCTEKNNHKCNQGHFFSPVHASDVEEYLHSCEQHAIMPQQ